MNDEKKKKEETEAGERLQSISAKLRDGLTGLSDSVKKLPERCKDLPERATALSDQMKKVQGQVKELPKLAGGLPDAWMRLSKKARRRCKLGTAWLLVLVIIINPFGSTFLTSVNNQEIFAYHIRDIAAGVTGNSVKEKESGDYYLSTGTYENQIDGPLFGAAQGKNLIVIQVEAFQNLVINREYNGQVLTPNLNSLIQTEGTTYFDNYYQQIGSGNTSDAEFATNNGLLGSVESYTYKLFEKNYFRGLPWILKDLGYDTAAFHGYDKEFWNRSTIYPNLGFDQFFDNDYFKNDRKIGLNGGNLKGISDTAFFEQATEALKSMKQPFYGFMITLSSHHPFQLPNSLQGIELEPDDEDTLFGDYLNAVHYADQSIGAFIQELKDEGLYENTVIAIYGDHFGLQRSDEQISKQVSKLIGKKYDLATMMNIPLIIHVPGVEQTQTISISGGQTDFMPTISYLLGVKNLDTLYTGQNLFTAENGFVPQETHMLKGSFIKDDVAFEMSRDGVFDNSRAWNIKTGEKVDISPFLQDHLKAKQTVELADFYLKNDVLRKALIDGMTIDEILTGSDKHAERPLLIAMAGSGTAAATADHTAEENPGTDSGDSMLDSSVNDAGEAVSFVNMEEALSHSYSAGYRQILVDGTAQRDLSDKIHGWELAVWMETHPDAEIYLRAGSEMKDTLELMAGTEESKRIIPVAVTMDEYTKAEYAGYRDILFMPDLSLYSLEELKSFIDMNTVWAVALPGGSVTKDLMKKLKKADFVYSYTVNREEDRKAVMELGIDGIITQTLK